MRSLDLPFARAAHDRAAHRRSEPGLLDDLLKEPATRVLVVRGTRVATRDQRVAFFAPDDVAHLGARTVLFLGEGPEVPGDGGPGAPGDGGAVAYLAVVLADAGRGPGADPVPEPDLDVEWTGLRSLDASDLEVGLVVEAVALAQWHAVYTHCPLCGTRTEVRQGGWVRHCPADESNHFPRTDPAVIMAVTDADDRLLLARGPQWDLGRRSVLAGFVEPGEGLEQAVARETGEEVGITLDPASIEYRGSQSWPFPASLMLGFRARATSTELVRQEDEIAEAAWFTRDEVATAVADGHLGLPGRASIARSLIEEWFGGPIED